MTRKEEILKAAQHAFLKFGIEKITLDDIAKECGVKKTALYYYFKSKDDILAEMLLQKINEFEVQIREEVLNTENVKDRLRTYMRTKIRIMQENIPFIELLEKEGLPFKAKEFMHIHKRKIMDTDFCLVKEVLKQGIKNKRVSHKLDDSLVLMIMGVTYGTFIGRFLENTDWDIDAMIETSIDVIFNGIE
jgi:AcrR family transcriptional regulator